MTERPEAGGSAQALATGGAGANPTDRRSFGRALGWALVAAISTLAAAFFGYYTVRLIYINAAGVVPASHRQSGMYIGAVVFPVAVVVFGYVSLRSGRAAGRAMRGNGR